MRRFEHIVKVPGLYYLENVISEEEEETILNKPHNKSLAACYKSWDNSLVSTLKPLTNAIECDFDWVQILWLKFLTETNMGDLTKCSRMFDSARVNNYSSGDILAPHIDTVRKWGEWIVCLSLESDVTMKFALELLTPHKIKKSITMSHSILFRKRSMYILTGEARYKWTHEIEEIKSDRISINFRPFKTCGYDDDEQLRVNKRKADIFLETNQTFKT
jgi:hypothetical protein